MNSEIKKVLSKLERNGYEGYVVGGYVRDYLLGIQSFDVDICTNALPKDIIKIFNIQKGVSNYGSVILQYGKYNFDITTYRKESDYIKHRPKSIEYINNLLLDLERRDFTINSIIMNSEGKIFDYLDGKKDLNNKIIRTIGDTNYKLKQDPLRILRAIRFASILDFELEKEIINFIINNKNIIKEISFTRKQQELEKIFASKNILKGLNLLKKYNLLDVLEIKYDKIIPVPDILGIWAQIDFSSKYQFNKSSMDIIKKIKRIINNNVIDKYTLLYEEDLYVSLVAGEILGYTKKEINKIYHDMPIHKLKDLKINYQDISSLLNTNISSKIKTIYNDIIIKVLNKELKNNKRIIKKYIIKNWM